MFSGQSDGGSSHIEVPSSQVTGLCVKLTKFNEHGSLCLESKYLEDEGRRIRVQSQPGLQRESKPAPATQELKQSQNRLK